MNKSLDLINDCVSPFHLVGAHGYSKSTLAHTEVMASCNDFALCGEPDMIRKRHSEEKTNRGQRTMSNEPHNLLKTSSRV